MGSASWIFYGLVGFAYGLRNGELAAPAEEGNLDSKREARLTTLEPILTNMTPCCESWCCGRDSRRYT